MPRPRLALCPGLLLALGCNDYGFSDPSKNGTGELDSGEPSTVLDGGSGDGGAETGGDPCWEPEDGNEQNPAARLIVDSPETTVTVTFTLSDTAYQDTLLLDAPDALSLVDAWVDPIGTEFALGPYTEETELVFGVDVWDTGEHWQSGPASRNSDGEIHGAVTYEGDCSWLMGFEDLTGGGDRDYNDVVLRVRGMLRQEE